MVTRVPRSQIGKFAFYSSKVSFLFTNMIESTVSELHFFFSPSAVQENNNSVFCGMID
jgi:hypothetical protein